MKHIGHLRENLKKLKREDMIKKLSLSPPVVETEMNNSYEETEPPLSPTFSFSGIQLDSRHTSACPSICDEENNEIMECIGGNAQVPASSQNESETK